MACDATGCINELYYFMFDNASDRERLNPAWEDLEIARSRLKRSLYYTRLD